MQNSNHNTYSYSASQSSEIRRIREKYESGNKEDSGIERIRKLDGRVSAAASGMSTTTGIAGLLIFGFGLSCVLVWSNSLLLLGVISGIIGLALIIAAYPSYRIVQKAMRKKVAPEILKLIDELPEGLC